MQNVLEYKTASSQNTEAELNGHLSVRSSFMGLEISLQG